MHHFAFAFKHPFDAHQARAEQLAPLALDEMRPDDDINIAGLVLERYKYRSRGGARALATGNDTRRPHRRAAREQPQLIGGGEAHTPSGRPAQGQAMGAPGESTPPLNSPEALSLWYRRAKP